MLLLLQLATTRSTAVQAETPAWLDATKSVESRLQALLPTLSVEQLAAQTLHLWTTMSMAKIMATYNETGVGASYIAHPSGNGTCDSDPGCNLRVRLAANRALMKSCGIPLTFVAETLHSPWISQGVIMPMPATMGATWNTTLLTEGARLHLCALPLHTAAAHCRCTVKVREQRGRKGGNVQRCAHAAWLCVDMCSRAPLRTDNLIALVLRQLGAPSRARPAPAG